MEELKRDIPVKKGKHTSVIQCMFGEACYDNSIMKAGRSPARSYAGSETSEGTSMSEMTDVVEDEVEDEIATAEDDAGRKWRIEMKHKRNTVLEEASEDAEELEVMRLVQSKRPRRGRASRGRLGHQRVVQGSLAL